MNALVATVEKYVKLRKAGECYIGRCPFHKEKTGSFVVVPKRNTWHCFGCGKGGSQRDFINAVGLHGVIEYH